MILNGSNWIGTDAPKKLLRRLCMSALLSCCMQHDMSCILLL
jgi:hypothetical protein